MDFGLCRPKTTCPVLHSTNPWPGRTAAVDCLDRPCSGTFKKSRVRVQLWSLQGSTKQFERFTLWTLSSTSFDHVKERSNGTYNGTITCQVLELFSASHKMSRVQATLAFQPSGIGNDQGLGSLCNTRFADCFE